MLNYMVEILEDPDETLTGLTGIEWSYDARRDHVLSFVILTICIQG